MRKRDHMICVCGYWNDRHFEEWDEKTDESFWKCLNCDCDDFEPDHRAMRELENEAEDDT